MSTVHIDAKKEDIKKIVLMPHILENTRASMLPFLLLVWDVLVWGFMLMNYISFMM